MPVTFIPAFAVDAPNDGSGGDDLLPLDGFLFSFFARCIFAVQVVGKCFPVHLPATWRGYLSNRLPEKQMTQQQREAVFFYNSSCSLVCGSEESEIND